MTGKAAFEKQDRAARLVKVLQLVMGAPGGITAAEIGRRTERHKRTALRDLEALQTVGVPLLMDGDHYRLMPDYILPTVSFTQPETMMVLLATRLAVQHIDYYNEFLAMALNKLAGTLPNGPVKVYVGESASQLATKPDNPERQQVFGAITQGLLERKQIAFSYVDSVGHRSRRQVHPYFLEPVSLMTRGTYLMAKDIDRKDMRTFKLDRISEAEVLSTDAYVPRDIQLQSLVANSWGIWGHDRVEHVELLFSDVAQGRVRETVWHPSQKLKMAPDGRLRLTLDVRGVVEITPWVLSWGADVEVVAPAALRKRLAEISARMGATYQDEG
jgi:proteasome accessory factor B